ncbi:MAG: YhcG nuclease domain [Mucilaginibacter sp.]|nr:YhcG nuclease domain [Mucilaginibacter sp.]
MSDIRKQEIYSWGSTFIFFLVITYAFREHQTLEGEEFYIDLLFYHRSLRCLIAFEDRQIHTGVCRLTEY